MKFNKEKKETINNGKGIKNKYRQAKDEWTNKMDTEIEIIFIIDKARMHKRTK